MAKNTPVQELHALRRSFGRAATARKLRLLAAIAGASRLRARDLVLLQATLDFIRAYPDNAQVRRSCERAIATVRACVQASRTLAGSAALANSGVPGSTSEYPYSFAMSRYLTGRFPQCVEVDWDDVEDESRITSTFELLLTGVENEAMEDVQLWWGEWAPHVRPRTAASDLAFVLGLFEHSHFSPQEQSNLFEALNLTIRYRLTEPGTGRCEVAYDVPKLAFQRRDVARERFELAPRIRAPMRVPRPVGVGTGRLLVDVAMRALASRNLEIHPLLNASPSDVILYSAERGIQVALMGVLPEHRGSLAALYFFLVLKNGVPIAYGPASPFLGSCEMGINLFPEFRGGEIRYLYAQVMRLLHHALGVEHFYLTSYGMGDGNEEAIQSGAFWFYRSLGFSASNPEVEALARSEERRIRSEPGYRSSVRMLRRLSNTEAHLDLSDGRCARFPFGRLGLAVSREIASRFAGNRARATQRCTRDALRWLGTRTEGWSPLEHRFLREISVVLAMLPDIESWSEQDKTALARIIKGKAARSEAAAGTRMKKHRRFRSGLWALVAEG